MPAESEEEEHEPEKVGACREQVSDERGGGKKAPPHKIARRSPARSPLSAISEATA